MSRTYKIRWKQSDQEQLTKAVKNFNAKISRLAKKYPDIKNALPEKLSVRQIKKLIETRQDLIRELNAMHRFTSKENIIRKNEDGSYEGMTVVPGVKNTIPITKWQLRDMKRRKRYVDKKREKRLDEINAIELEDRGNPVGYTQAQVGMGKAEKLALSPVTLFTPGMDIYGFRKRYRGLMKESQSSYWNNRDNIMKEAYIKALYHNFRGEDVKEIIEIIDSMDSRKFRSIFEKEIGKFENIYMPDFESYDGFLEAQKTIFLPNKGRSTETYSKPSVKYDDAMGGRTMTSLGKWSQSKSEQARIKVIKVFVREHNDPLIFASGSEAVKHIRSQGLNLSYYTIEYRD